MIKEKTKEEHIEEIKKWITAYRLTIADMENNINILLNGKLLKEEIDGKIIYHAEFNAIKKINYEIAQITSRLQIAEKNLILTENN